MRNDTQGAASSVVAFLVAGVIFVGSVGALLVVSRDGTDVSGDSPASAATLGLQSQALADLVVSSPGFHYDANAEYVLGWGDAEADDLGRLGLRETDSLRMDFEKFQNLRRAGYASSADGRVNYPDARSSLGLDDLGLDFHLRAFPSLQSVRDLLANGERDPNLRVAYIGDVEAVSNGADEDPAAGLTVGSLTCTVGTDSYTLSLPVTNGGMSATQFSAFFDIDWTGNTKDYQDRVRTSLVTAGGSAVLSLKVPYTSGRTCNSGDVDLEIWDPTAELWDDEFDLDTSGTPGTLRTKDLWVNPGRSYYLPGENVVIDFGGDLPTKNNDPSVTLSLVVKQGATTVLTQSVVVTKSVRSVTLDDSYFTAANDYTVELTYPSGVTVTDTILVTNTIAVPLAFAPAGGGAVTYDPQVSVAPEVGYLDDLVERFCPYYFDSNTETPDASAAAWSSRCTFDRLSNPHPGDVYPDTRDVLNNDLVDRLIDPTYTSYVQQCPGNIVGGPRYDWTKVLVVGSNVDHNSMTSADAKYAVCEWVMAGGTMIVFGSADQQVNWLQPIFHAAITSSSAPVSTPDASHPILNRADSLAYDGYTTNGTKVWSFNGQTAQNQEDLLTNVVASGGSDSILTISNPGAFGDGNIILTTWLPYDLFGTGASLEGLKVVNNLLMQGYRDLFLDYGPQIPSSSRQAAAAQRVVDIQHPEFDDPITLTLFVYVF